MCVFIDLSLSWRDKPGAASLKPAVKKKRHEIPPASYSLLLESIPEVSNGIRSFLNLSDNLVLSSSCRQLLLDVSFYCKLYKDVHADDTRSTLRVSKFSLFRIIICAINRDLSSIGVFQRHDIVHGGFVWWFVYCSPVDNGAAVSALLEIDKCSSVNVHLLDVALKKDMTAIAAVLQEEERIKNGIFRITMCSKCSDNIGCYSCAQALAANSCSARSSLRSFRLCRPCALAENRFCKGCEESICADCFAAGNYFRCEDCDEFACNDYKCAGVTQTCNICRRTKCVSCIEASQEGWYLTQEHTFLVACPPCQATIPAERGDY